MNKQTIKRSQIEEWDIDRLMAYKHNAKLHPDSHIEQIANSIKEFTFLDPIAVDENGEVLEGHGRLLAAKRRGDSTIPVIQITGLSDAQKVAYRLAHNKLTMNTGFDPEMLKIDFEFLQNSDFELSLTGFGELELSFLDDEPEEENGSGEGGNDDDFEPPEKIESRVKPGEIWQLGRHFLCCADSTVESNVRALLGDRFGEVGMVFTDPPYNVAYEGKTEEKLVIQNDSFSSSDDFYKFLLNYFTGCCNASRPGAAIYVCHADIEGENFRKALKVGGYLYKQSLVWVKQSLVLGRQDYHWKHEPILYGWKPGAAHNWYSDRSQTTVWNFDRPTASREHPTMKPLDLVEYALGNSSADDDLIFDGFLGSGSTLIAAQNMKGDRTVYGFELSPDYCEVIIQRFEKFTGIEAKLIGTLSTKLKDGTQSEEYLNSLGF